MLGHCSNKYTVKSIKTSGSSRSILRTSSDSKITSGRINLESNEWYKRKLELYNILNICCSDCGEVLKLIKKWNYRLEEHDIQLPTGCFNGFTNLFSLLGFSSRLFLVGSSCKSKLDRKNDSKESHCINESGRVPLHLPKHLPRLKHLEETWLISFITSLLLKFLYSLSWFFRLPLLPKWSYL